MQNQKSITSIEDLAQMIVTTMASKEDLTGLATKEDLIGLATKADVRRVENKLDSVIANTLPRHDRRLLKIEKALNIPSAN